MSIAESIAECRLKMWKTCTLRLRNICGLILMRTECDIKLILHADIDVNRQMLVLKHLPK